MELIKSLDEVKAPIIEPRVIPVTIKRLATFDGAGTAEGVKIGQDFLIDIKSVRMNEITNQNGKKHNKLCVNVVDVNGKILGWMYAELFFSNDEFVERFVKK